MGYRNEYEVEIRYPYRSTPDDETWLAAAVSRHGGELSEWVMESFPARRRAWFQAATAGRAFVDELEGTGRWEAELSPL